MHITIIGSGLTGSMFMNSVASHMLSANWQMDICLIDGDTIEVRNSPSNLPIGLTGQAKATVMANRMFDAEIAVTPVVKMVDADNVAELLEGFRVVVGCLDNIPTRQIIYAHCKKNGIPYIDIGVSDVSCIVTWTVGEIDNFPYTNDAIWATPEDVKHPPCHIVSTRHIAALATESAAMSLSVYIHGEDVADLVSGCAGKKAEIGDCVAWNGMSAGNEWRMSALYLGNNPGVIE